VRGGKASRVLLGLVATGAVVVVGAKIASEKLFEQPLIDGCYAHVEGQTTRLSIEEAENAALISALSIQHGMPARAASIALAAAFQESGLRNIDYGDRDSLGLFQQRPSSGWGTEAQVQDPVYAANKFYDHLVTVPGWDTGRLTEVSQAVQRSAYPDAYAQWEGMAQELTTALAGGGLGTLACT
jgi:hypothetical protein